MNNADNVYNENTIDISSNAFDTDFDNIAFEPTTVDDSNDEAAEKYGYDNDRKENF